MRGRNSPIDSLKLQDAIKKQTYNLVTHPKLNGHTIRPVIMSLAKAIARAIDDRVAS